MNKTTVINLWGAPGAGKSTTAAMLFSLMKLRKMSVELVTEFAKELAWEGRLKNNPNQFLISAQQYNRLHILKGKVDYIVTDSPLLLGLVYSNEGVIFEEYLYDKYFEFNNLNYYIKRVKAYVKLGREQTKIQAAKKSY